MPNPNHLFWVIPLVMVLMLLTIVYLIITKTFNLMLILADPENTYIYVDDFLDNVKSKKNLKENV